MAGIPLVNSNGVDDINTSIIAIKKEINSVGNTEVNVTLNMPENSIPVDAVTSGDMHAVTSNAVAEVITPDYANAVAKLASDGSFVADTDGWIACKLLGYSLGGDTSAEVQIYDDENSQNFISACFAYVSTGAIGTSSIVKVNKGNKIKLTIASNFSNSGCVVYFIPNK